MKVSTFFILLSIVFLSKIRCCLELNTEDYSHLLLDLYDTYQPSSVLLVYFANIDSPPEIKIVFEVMLVLSKRKILTLTIPFEEVLVNPSKNSSESSHKDQAIRQTTRSMSVILFTSQKAIDKLKNFSEHMDLDVPINFILFMVNDDSFDEYCIESLRNKLQFSFHATILIKCYGDPTVKQWYPFNVNQTEFVTRGYWKPNARLTLKTKDSINMERGSLGGKVLRTATVESSYLAHLKNGKLIGYLADVLLILEDVMNFKTKHVKEESEFGSWNESTQTWSGAMGLIVRGEVDLIISGLLLTRQRLLSVDFTISLFSTQDSLYVKEPSDKKGIIWTGYFQPFNYRSWMAIFLLILTSSLVLILINKKLKNSSSFSHLIAECYLNVWSIYCQQGLKEFPAISSLRLAYFSIFVCSFIVMALYSASLISYLTVPTSSLPFSSLEGFVKDGSYKLIVTRDGSEYDMFKKSNESIFWKMNKLMLPKNNLPLTEDDGFNMICNKKVAFYESEILDQRNNNIPCEVIKIPTGQFDSAGMVLRKGSPFRKMINYQLNQLKKAGILSRLKSKYFKKTVQSKNDNFISVSISGITVLLVILAGGIILGIIILFFEKIYFNHRLENVHLPTAHWYSF